VHLNIQQRAVSSQFTLPFISVIGCIVWFLLKPTGVTWTSLLLALVASALAVYMLAEFNSRNVLLRVSSRVISSLLALLLTITLPLHDIQAGHITMLLSLFSFFPFFLMYQSPSPALTFVAYLALALSSFVFPAMLLLVPFYWMFQAYMRGMTFRCLVASLLALLVPYWIYLGILVYLDDYETIQRVAARFSPAAIGGQHWLLRLAEWSIVQTAQFLYVLLILLVGLVDFYIKSHYDKTRVRIIYNIVIMHALVVVLQLLCAGAFYQLLPLLMVDAAIVGGHFVAQTQNRFSLIFVWLMLLAGVALIAISYITPQARLDW